MIGIALSLTSALFWGSSDFLAGMQSRRGSAFVVVLWNQAVGAVPLLAVLAVLHPTFSAPGAIWGLVGGSGGILGLLLFYRGLATGIMSVVAPVSACGVIVPVLFSFASGHIPAPLEAVGIAAAIAGIVLVSAQPPDRAYDRGLARRAVGLAAGAAVGFGLYLVCIGHGSSLGSPLWTVIGGRAGSLSVLGLIKVVTRWPVPRPSSIASVTLVGLLDTSANLTFAVASTLGTLVIVAVLGALYPVATVVLSQVVLRERLTKPHAVGVALTLAGVVLVSVP